MSRQALTLPGSFVSIPLPGKAPDLDGFLAHKATRSKTLLVFVHGMGGNFFRSPFKKAFMSQGLRAGMDVISFNNRGALDAVVHEQFKDCLADLDAVLAYGRRCGYRRFILVGHSTGCQKISYYQAVRKDKQVAALVLAAPADDYALARKQLGRQYNHWVRKARQMVKDGKGNETLPPICNGFSARRFLDVAIPTRLEASVFNYDGPLKHFRALRLPVIAMFGSDEEFAVLPVDEMGGILKSHSRAEPFHYVTIAGGDHSFRGCEVKTVRMTLRWLAKHAL
jgi:pimeloyl-ACP methyl ester carboxylesterase